MVLDLVSIAAIASPFVAKGAEAFAKVAGEKLGGKIDQLSQAVIDKFKGDSYAEQTLVRAREMPDSVDRQGALKAVLEEKLKEDFVFAEETRGLVEELQKGKASSNTIFDQRGQTVGTQTNIGNVQGTVNIAAK
jgi:hypothetical protein